MHAQSWHSHWANSFCDWRSGRIIKYPEGRRVNNSWRVVRFVFELCLSFSNMQRRTERLKNGSNGMTNKRHLKLAAAVVRAFVFAAITASVCARRGPTENSKSPFRILLSSAQCLLWLAARRARARHRRSRPILICVTGINLLLSLLDLISGAPQHSTAGNAHVKSSRC